ncbi:putative phosphatase regulatory subunit-domain-containing protein [Chytridium lagenaria]|nr:putative phosphatase regulatory subunit-domain-containing protein [Chytridium lagenaria]
MRTLNPLQLWNTTFTSTHGPPLPKLVIPPLNPPMATSSTPPLSLVSPNPRPYIRPILKSSLIASSQAFLPIPAEALAASLLASLHPHQPPNNSLTNPETSSTAWSCPPSPTDSTISFITSFSESNSSSLATPRGSDFGSGPKSITFDHRLEQVCVFSAEDSPVEISKSPVYDVESRFDLDDDEDGEDFQKDVPFLPLSMSSPRMPATTWTIVARTAGTTSSFSLGANVALDTILLEPPSPTHTLSGTILVRNLAFEKEVFVRLSLDDWLTHLDIRAPFAGTLCPTVNGFLGIDRFTFRLDVENLGAAALGAVHPEIRIVMAICCRMAGREYWDNNRGVNHSAVLRLDPSFTHMATASWVQSVSSIRCNSE